MPDAARSPAQTRPAPRCPHRGYRADWTRCSQTPPDGPAASPARPAVGTPPARSGHCGGCSGGRYAVHPRPARPTPHGSPARFWPGPDRYSPSLHTGPAPGARPRSSGTSAPDPPIPRCPAGGSARSQRYPAAGRRTPTRRSGTPPARRPDGAPPGGAPAVPPTPARTAGHPGSAPPGSSRRRSTPTPGTPAWGRAILPAGIAAARPNTNCYM